MSDKHERIGPSHTTIYSPFSFKLIFPRRSEGGIAPVSGTGDRGFESRRFDQKTVFDGLFFILSKPTRTRTHLAHLHCVSTWFVTDICSHFASARLGFAFSAQSASSSLVSGKRENIQLWRKSRFSFPLLIVRGYVIFQK